MRRTGLVVGGFAALLAASGCAVADRQWGSCGTTGAVVGALMGGVAGGAALNNSGDPSGGAMAGTIIGGTIGGAALGGLLGHVVCDPEREEAPPPAPES